MGTPDHFDPFLYRYKALVTDVYDGDTCTVTLDLGFDITWEDQKVRLYGIDTPELRGIQRPDGLAARDHLSNLVLGREVVLRTDLDKTEKYGRLLGTIYLRDPGVLGSGWLLVNQLMVDAGHARIETYDDKPWLGWPPLGAKVSSIGDSIPL